MMTTYRTVIYALMLSFLIAGCSRTTTITKPDGAVWAIRHSTDAIVEYAKGDERVTIDDRGKASFFEEVMKLWMLKELNEED